MFWFKRKKIYVDCFISDPLIANYNPIKKAQHYVPDWWKKLKSTYSGELSNGMKVDFSTMKSCSGFTNLYQKGFIIPLWSDVAIDLTKEGYRYNFALSGSENEPVGTHPAAEHGNNFNNHLHIKILSPWILKEKTEAKFLFTGCTWSLAKHVPKMTVLTGIVDYKYQHSTHINTFFSLDGLPYRSEIDAGTPMVHIIPISEKQIEPRVQLVDSAEYERIKKETGHFKFRNAYKSKAKSKSI